MPRLAEDRCPRRSEPEQVTGLSSRQPGACEHMYRRGSPCSLCLMPAGTVPRTVAPLKLALTLDQPDPPDEDEHDSEEESDDERTEPRRRKSKPRPPAPEGLLYSDEVARVLGVSLMTVSSYTAKLRPVRSGKRYLYDAARVHAFAKERAAKKEGR